MDKCSCGRPKIVGGSTYIGTGMDLEFYNCKCGSTWTRPRPNNSPRACELKNARENSVAGESVFHRLARFAGSFGFLKKFIPGGFSLIGERAIKTRCRRLHSPLGHPQRYRGSALLNGEPRIPVVARSNVRKPLICNISVVLPSRSKSLFVFSSLSRK